MDVLERRAPRIFAVFLALLVVAAGRTAYLDVVRGATLRRAAMEEHVTDEALRAPRGELTDDTGAPLALSEPAQDLAADPLLLSDPLSDARRLAPLLEQPMQAILTKLTERAGFVYLARGVPERRAEKVLALGIPGVSGTPVMHRVYPRAR